MSQDLETYRNRYGAGVKDEEQADPPTFGWSQYDGRGPGEELLEQPDTTRTRLRARPQRGIPGPQGRAGHRCRRLPRAVRAGPRAVRGLVQQHLDADVLGRYFNLSDRYREYLGELRDLQLPWAGLVSSVGSSLCE